MMRLETYREQEGLSYENLARKLNLTINKTYRICRNKTNIKLQDAHNIVKETGGKVGFTDLLIEDTPTE